jgi:hypothetical protein
MTVGKGTCGFLGLSFSIGPLKQKNRTNPQSSCCGVVDLSILSGKEGFALLV